MVDVGEKAETGRIAVASGRIRMHPETLEAIRHGAVPKGDVLGTARLAGILAAKRTPEWIPLCHPIRLTGVEVTVTEDDGLPGLSVRAEVRAMDRTGVEMEALAAVAAALLTAYDMVKGIDRAMEIGPIRLDRKEGGRSGLYVRDETGA
jgi:cyclic pyranopterin phosphate synthase